MLQEAQRKLFEQELPVRLQAEKIEMEQRVDKIREEEVKPLQTNLEEVLG